MKNNLKGSLILGLAALIWGLAFVAQSDGADLVPSFMFNALRSLIASAGLLAFWYITNKNKRDTFFPKEKDGKKEYLKAGIICGVLLTVSVNLQQFGISLYPDGAASEARSGFLTALYVIIVPLISVFSGKKINAFVFSGVLIATAGIYLLCFDGGISGIYFADLLVFLCAISFSLHIMAIDRYVGITGGVKLSVLQFAVCGVLSLLLSFIFETASLNFSNIIAAYPQILYLGIMSSGVAYTLQIVGQKYAEPPVASISMSFESVFAALGGWLISGNSLSVRQIIGCALVFAAITVAQAGDFKKKTAN